MSSYAMQAALDNGFSLMTDCWTITQLMLNSFSLLNFTSLILFSCAAVSSPVGEVSGCAVELPIPSSGNDSPALLYCIVFCIIRLVVKALGDTAICQVHLLWKMQRNNSQSSGSLLSNRWGLFMASTEEQASVIYFFFVFLLTNPVQAWYACCVAE